MAERKACCLKETAVRPDVEIAKTKTKQAISVAVLGPAGSTAVCHAHANFTRHITIHKRIKPRNRNGSCQRLQTMPTNTIPRNSHMDWCPAWPLLRRQYRKMGTGEEMTVPMAQNMSKAPTSTPPFSKKMQKAKETIEACQTSIFLWSAT